MDDIEAVATFRSDSVNLKNFTEEFILQADKLIHDAIYGMQASNPMDVSIESLLDFVQESLWSQPEDEYYKSLLYNHLKQYVKSRLQHCIDKQLRCSSDIDDDDNNLLVSVLCDNIMKTSEYETLLSDARIKLGQTSERGTLHFPNTLSDSSKFIYNRENVSPTNESDSSSLTSSYVAAFWELSPERLLELAEALDSKNKKQTREVALKALYSLSVADIVEFDSWPLLGRSITETLIGPEDSTFKLGLRLHTKMLHSTSSTCTLEGYVSLVKALSSTLETITEIFPFNCELKDTRFERAHQICGLMNAYQKIIPRYWTRFLEKHSKLLAQETVDLMMPNKWSSVSFQVVPFNIMALVDCKAKWFTRWTRGHHGRMLLYEQLKIRSVLPELVSECLNYFDLLNVNSTCHIPNHQSYLRYCCVLYSVSILYCILSSLQGAELFDSQLKLTGIQMTGTDFLVQVLQIAFNVCKTTHECNAYCIVNVLCHSLKCIIEQDSSCNRHMSDGRIVSTILELLHYWSSGPQDEVYDIAPADLHALHHATSILFHLVESTIGCNVILTRSETLATIIAFSKKILLVSEHGVAVPHDKVLETVKTAAVKICCCIMATHSGIYFMMMSEILQGIAEDWVSNLQDDKTIPLLSASSHKFGQDKDMQWLLEFSKIGCTPKGLTALYDVELLQDVLVGVEKELTRNAEISELLPDIRLTLSQVALACSVEPSLWNNLMPLLLLMVERVTKSFEDGFTSNINNNILPLLLDRLERLLQQFLSDIFCVLPSCLDSSVAFDSKNVFDLWNMVGFDADAAYYCDDVGSQFTLWLLSFLSSSLDLWIHFESRHSVIEALITLQHCNAPDEYEQPQFDHLFLLRNRLLVKVVEIGGDCEKMMPPLFLHQNQVNLDEVLQQCPLVTSLQLPDHYHVTLPPLVEAPLEIERFLKETTLETLDAEWLTYCQEVFRNCLENRNIRFRGLWYGNLLYYAAEVKLILGSKKCKRNGRNLSIDGQDDVNEKAHKVAMDLILRYGIRLGLLDSENNDLWDNLQRVMMQTHKQNKGLIGVDWIAATSFLLLNGDPERTIQFRESLVGLNSEYWSCIKSPSSDVPLSNNFWMNFCHNVEVVLNGDLPLVAYALKRSGLAVGQVCILWLKQIFWNILDWEEICSFFGLCLLMGDSYMVYYVVALFRHLQADIIMHAEEGSVSIFLRETKVKGFCTTDYLPFMDHLESKYHGTFQQHVNDTT